MLRYGKITNLVNMNKKLASNDLSEVVYNLSERSISTRYSNEGAQCQNGNDSNQF